MLFPMTGRILGRNCAFRGLFAPCVIIARLVLKIYSATTNTNTACWKWSGLKRNLKWNLKWTYSDERWRSSSRILTVLRLQQRSQHDQSPSKRIEQRKILKRQNIMKVS